MAELQRNFLQGIMNKDLDPHFLPDGQYRDGLNIIVGDSDGQFVSIEGSNNGAAQNYLGNTLMNSALGLTNARCIGSISVPAEDKIFWLIAADNADAVYEYNEFLNTTTIVLKATKANITSSSILNFNKSFYVTGINYINGLLFWTDNYNPPRRINVERAKNYAVNGFDKYDINVIVAPPLFAPLILLSNTGDSNNLEDKFLYFSYRYKYVDDEYSALSPFSPVAFLPKKYAYDYGVSENISMINNFDTVSIQYNRGTENVKEVQLVYRDTSSTNIYVIDNIETRTLSNDLNQIYRFKNNKVYTILDPNQVNRLFDNVPLKAKSQELIGSRLIYGNYTQFFNLVNCEGDNINPVFSLSLTTESITNNFPKPTFKSNRDYEVGIVYLDDYGRSTTVIIPEGNNTVNLNTIYIPPQNASLANNIRVTIDKDFEPPCFATYYRFVLKQNKQDYYNLFPLNFIADGQFKWFLINQADVDKISVGSYLYLKNSSNGNLNTQFKVLDIVSQPANFLNNDKSQPAGLYFRLKIGSNVLPEIYYYDSYSLTTDASERPIVNGFRVAQNPIFYGTGLNNLSTSFGNNIIITFPIIDTDVRFTIQIDSTGVSDTYKFYAFFDNTNNLIASNQPIVAGADITLYIPYLGVNRDVCKIKFATASGHTIDDYWTIMCRISSKNIFGGRTIANQPYAYATTAKWNLNDFYLGDRPINPGAILTFKMKEPNNGDTEIVQSFTSTRYYVNIEEWFIEDFIYTKWIQYYDTELIGARNVNFYRLKDIYTLTGTQYQGDAGSIISTSTLDAPMFMWINGQKIGTNPQMEVSFSLQQSLSPLLLETVPEDNNQDIYYELTGTLPIENGNHYSSLQSQIIGVQPAIVDLNTFGFNSNFNAFAWGNNVESYRIRDDFNSATMEFSPRANSTVEGYAEQTLVQALTYSGVYQQTTAINRLNEFNLSLGNFKYLDLFFGSIEKLYARDTDLVVLQENKISKVLYGKNLLSDSTGGGVVASIPEVLGTQISYVGEYGISNNPESFAIWGNDMFFTDARRGAVLRLSDNGLFEISSDGMKNWFKYNLNPNTFKIGMMDPYFEHYVLANNNIEVSYCLLEVNPSYVTFPYIAGYQQITITSNKSWIIEIPANNWLTASSLSGNGNATIILTVSQNMGNLRSLILRIIGCSGTKEVAVYQQGQSQTCFTWDFYNSGDPGDPTENWTYINCSGVPSVISANPGEGNSSCVLGGTTPSIGSLGDNPFNTSVPCASPTTTTTTDGPPSCVTWYFNNSGDLGDPIETWTYINCNGVSSIVSAEVGIPNSACVLFGTTPSVGSLGDNPFTSGQPCVGPTTTTSTTTLPPTTINPTSCITWYFSNSGDFGEPAETWSYVNCSGAFSIISVEVGDVKSACVASGTTPSVGSMGDNPFTANEPCTNPTTTTLGPTSCFIWDFYNSGDIGDPTETWTYINCAGVSSIVSAAPQEGNSACVLEGTNPSVGSLGDNPFNTEVACSSPTTTSTTSTTTTTTVPPSCVTWDFYNSGDIGDPTETWTYINCAGVSSVISASPQQGNSACVLGGTTPSIGSLGDNPFNTGIACSSPTTTTTSTTSSTTSVPPSCVTWYFNNSGDPGDPIETWTYINCAGISSIVSAEVGSPNSACVLFGTTPSIGSLGDNPFTSNIPCSSPTTTSTTSTTSSTTTSTTSSTTTAPPACVTWDFYNSGDIGDPVETWTYINCAGISSIISASPQQGDSACVLNGTTPSVGSLGDNPFNTGVGCSGTSTTTTLPPTTTSTTTLPPTTTTTSTTSTTSTTTAPPACVTWDFYNSGDIGDPVETWTYINCAGISSIISASPQQGDSACVLNGTTPSVGSLGDNPFNTNVACSGTSTTTTLPPTTTTTTTLPPTTTTTTTLPPTTTTTTTLPPTTTTTTTLPPTTTTTTTLPPTTTTTTTLPPTTTTTTTLPPTTTSTTTAPPSCVTWDFYNSGDIGDPTETWNYINCAGISSVVSANPQEGNSACVLSGTTPSVGSLGDNPFNTGVNCV